MLKTWLVTSGDMEKVRARAHDPMAAFLVAVILSSPKYLGAVAEVIEEQFVGDDDSTYFVKTDILTSDVQGHSGKDWLLGTVRATD